MAKKYSRTTSKRKTTRNKRKSTRKMAVKRSPYNSTWNYMKCTYEKAIEHRVHTVGTDPTAARFVVKWGDVTLDDGYSDQSFIPRMSKEYNAMRGLYRIVEFTGVKIQWEGYTAVGGEREYRTARIWSNPNECYLPEATSGPAALFWDHDRMRQFPDYKEYKGNPNISKYVGVSKYYRKRSMPYDQDLSSTVTPKACTAFELNSKGFAAGHDMGRVRITWYCIFKQPKLD